MSRHTYVCSYCGSDSVGCDASMYWDVDAQKWEVGSFRDDDWCGGCDSETTTEEVDIDTIPAGEERVVMVNEIMNPDTHEDYKAHIKCGDEADYWLSNRSTEEVNDSDVLVIRKTDSWQWEVVTSDKA